MLEDLSQWLHLRAKARDFGLVRPSFVVGGKQLAVGEVAIVGKHQYIAVAGTRLVELCPERQRTRCFEVGDR